MTTTHPMTRAVLPWLLWLWPRPPLWLARRLTGLCPRHAHRRRGQHTLPPPPPPPPVGRPAARRSAGGATPATAAASPLLCGRSSHHPAPGWRRGRGSRAVRRGETSARGRLCRPWPPTWAAAAPRACRARQSARHAPSAPSAQGTCACVPAACCVCQRSDRSQREDSQPANEPRTAHEHEPHLARSAGGGRLDARPRPARVARARVIETRARVSEQHISRGPAAVAQLGER
jgi:hypothetical protein